MLYTYNMKLVSQLIGDLKTQVKHPCNDQTCILLTCSVAFRVMIGIELENPTGQ